MKFQITLKDPDGIFDAIDDVAKIHALRAIESAGELGGALDADKVREDFRDAIKSHTREFIRDGEYLTVEFDTVAATCVVIKR